MIDLHMHSIFSDGTSPPSDLVRLAEEYGLSAIALTDHDTVAGLQPLFDAARGSPIEAIAGIEISADCPRGTMHILGYLIDYTCPMLIERLETVRKGRELRNLEILKRLNKLGYVLQWSDVEAQAGEDVVGRPHFAEALVQKGHVKNRKAAFELLLAKGRPAYADRKRFSASESIEMIHASGGVAVLAHPSTLCLKDNALRQVIEELKSHGLGGLETYYSSHRSDQVSKYAQWAKELGLVCTGGSDFHGDNTPDIKIGSGFGQLNIPDSVLAELKAVAPA